MKNSIYKVLGLIGFMLLAVSVPGCSSSDSSSGAGLVRGDFSIAYVKRSVEAVGNPTDGAIFVAGGDLYVRDLSAPGSAEENITAQYTNGQGDVSDPEVSYDGTRILFSMKLSRDDSWNIWEYSLHSKTARRWVEDDELANEGDDVDPYYLPDGRIIFTSNRQEKSRQLLVAEGKEPFRYLDEYEREETMVLHVVNQQGDEIRQISFNQSHDRNPVVLSGGELMFSRWEHAGDRNQFPLFFSNPDGTSMFVLYGRFSPGNSFLHPREMPDGRVISSLMPLLGTGEGGALVLIDVKNYSENDLPGPGVPAGGEAQQQATLQEIPLGRGYSEFGRYTTPYPLHDGSNRVLVSWTASQEPAAGEAEDEDGPPRYGVYMFNLDDKTLRPIVLAAEGQVITDPIALMAHPEPNIVSDKAFDQDLADAGMGILNVRSVYDTDVLDMMGDRMLIPGEVIPKIGEVVDVASIKTLPASARPGRFMRFTRAVPTPPGTDRESVGSNNMEMQEILGYGEVEPDGSFRFKVPADMPLGLVVVDEKGRALQSHPNWVQVRPGETRTCNGCHSPRRGSAINTTPIAGNHAGTKFAGLEESGETMAETRTRLDASVLDLQQDMNFSDVWTLDADGPDADLIITYSGLTTLAPVQGIINYQEHIQPIWNKHNCSGCHAGQENGLDLRDNVSGTGRMVAYESLTLGVPELDNEGNPVTEIVNGEVEIVRADAVVDVGSAVQSSRSSHLIEKLYETELRAEQLLPVASVNHAGMLNQSEMRLVQEWVDIGAQYHNTPYVSGAGDDGVYALDEVRGAPAGLDEDVFESSIQLVLLSRCGSCHSARGSDGAVNPDFSGRRFVLTGSVEGDFNNTISMIADVCQPQSSALLLRPVVVASNGVVHPAIDGEPVMNTADADYQVILSWINQSDAVTNCP